MRSIKGFEVSLREAGTVLENLLSQRKQCLSEGPQVRLANPQARRQLVANIKLNLVNDVEHYRLWPQAPSANNESTSISNIKKDGLFQFWMDKSRRFPDSSRINPRLTYESTMVSLLVIQIVLLAVLLFSFSKIHDALSSDEQQKTDKRN